jgi:hypothetical protein
LRWGWGSTKVSNFLKTLSDLDMINQRQTGGQTIIKLSNYGTYNDNKDSSKPPDKPEANQGQTTDKPEANQSKEREEYNKLNNLKNNNPPLPSQTEGRSLIDSIRSIFHELKVPDNATEAQRIVVNELESNRFNCKTEYPVKERGDGHQGRIDIFAQKDGYDYAIEIDRLTPRDKSILKLKQVDAIRIILTRGGKNEIAINDIALIFPLKIQNEPGFNLSFISAGLQEPFQDWLSYKKAKQQTYKTQKSLEACYAHLLKLAGNDPETAKKIITQSMANNWAGLFELKESNETSNENFKESIMNKLEKLKNENRQSI